MEERENQTDGQAWDLDDPELYLNRELTWLAFNERVLAEAADPRSPLLERVKFLAIVGGTLDEFFMKRIGGLKQQIGAGVVERSQDGRTPLEQLQACHTTLRARLEQQQSIFHQLVAELRAEDIHLVEHDELTDEQQARVRADYLENVFPLVTPQAMDPAHPFPFISNLSLNLLVSLRVEGDRESLMARIKVPLGSGVDRLVRVGEEHRYVPLEQVMAANLDLLFPGLEVRACSFFRVTRNANTETDEEHADDLLSLIESELRERRFAPIVRLQVSEGIPALHKGMLAAELGLDEESDVFVPGRMMGLADLFELTRIQRPELHDPPHHAVDHPELAHEGNIFHRIRNQGPILVHQPYQSFATSVERLLLHASTDPKVRAIKMTLYRTASESRVIELLRDAALNGKQVTVVVELKARFDEAANIRWASRLESSGIHVTYGVVGLKTHCKCILVVRRDYDGLRRYAHLGTGNYHSGTARLYTDLGLLTCDPDIGHDLTELFNYLTTGYRPKRNYRKLLVAPKLMKPRLLECIERERNHALEGRKGWIQLKVNALEDRDLTRALYRASQAGVCVQLIVRDTCRLRPGLPGLSENVSVMSVVGRFLEHARIYCFHNDGAPEYYLGSADTMKRNLESRVEVLTPVDDPTLQDELKWILEVQLRDHRRAWDMHSDGSYTQRQPETEAQELDCQERAIRRAETVHKAATRLKKRKTKGPIRR